ncbi:unnamed protein product [Macrosiphum euphorbiae]|uniref:Reverse transcriptase domain-containing protein n=1 Tax=Macrosiphum euphorbiae TaxID=13131 RepID=A0AAV0W7K1_9HEMI|nr:unnamed protein product [Macrosiphum euphorbiae]
MHEEAITEWKDISAGVPQGYVLVPILSSILCTYSIRLIYQRMISDNITLAMFANDMVSQQLTISLLDKTLEN